MERNKTITFAESAVKDLEALIAWYIEQRVPEAGERIVQEIIEQIERLAEFPESGKVVPEFETANLREIIYSPFRIVYRLDKSRVRLVRVWRGERQLKMP